MCIIPTPFGGSILTIEDKFGVGHERVLNATTFTVFALKRRVARLLDPLGVGLPRVSWPCKSVVAYGSPNVLCG